MESTEPGSFGCRVDWQPAFDCGSPEEVKVGVCRHKFFVTATDDADNEELGPAKYGFRRIRG